MIKLVNIFTDGSCLGNPGPGGYGVILNYKGNIRELSKGFTLTTNNRMELLAAITALQTLTETCRVDLHTDSQYVRNGVTKWMHNWKKNGWKTADKKAVKNRDLWQALDKQIQRHQIEWIWVKAHAGHVENERCDLLAKEAASHPTAEDLGYQEEC